jgi:hypothetical protein
MHSLSAKVGRSDCKATFENGTFSANYLRLSDTGIFQVELLRGDKSIGYALQRWKRFTATELAKLSKKKLSE